MSIIKQGLEVKDMGKQKMETTPTVNINQALENLMDIIVEKSDILIPFIGISALVILVIYQIYAAINDTDPLKNITNYIYLTIIPIIIIFSYIVYAIFDNKSKILFYKLVIGGLVLFGMVYAAITLSNLNLNLTLQNIISYGFIAIITLLGLYLFYSVFANQFRTTDTWGSFWIEMIFYIPCAIEKFIKFLIKDYTNTSNVTIIMFAIEILFIIFYFYFFPMYKKSIYNDGIIVLEKPLFLNNEVSRLIQPLKDVDGDRMPSPSDSNNPLDILFKPNALTYAFRTNYAISMWVYVNPMPMTRIGYEKETNIFYYGTKTWYAKPVGTKPPSTPIPATAQYHPKVSLLQENDNYFFNFYYSGSESTHKLDLPLQKWNNIVFNYLSNGVDVFINGELTLSYNFSDDSPQYSEDDDIIIGDKNELNNNNGIISMNTNGIYGSICNAVYYTRPLTKREIVMNYNMLSGNNPPIIN